MFDLRVTRERLLAYEQWKLKPACVHTRAEESGFILFVSTTDGSWGNDKDLNQTSHPEGCESLLQDWILHGTTI